jgi:hypothetical protein
VHRRHGRAERLQLVEDLERGEVAAVDDQVGRGQLLPAAVRYAPLPARQVRVGDDRDADDAEGRPRPRPLLAQDRKKWSNVTFR